MLVVESSSRRVVARRAASGAARSSSIGKAVTPPQFRVFRDDGATDDARDGDTSRETTD
ncbi:hypothetical protein [Labedella populi]|uniref:hypothetical protein n=1 Tax=Labedella populi TaxID=2498850 RepID=UPI00140D0FFF|nr:hypothetical protein [Labedella populi]